MIAYTAMLFCGIAIIIFFVIKPLETILFYFAFSTVLQLLNNAWIKLPLSNTHITFGGIMLSIILFCSFFAITLKREKSFKEIRAVNIYFISFIIWMFASSLLNAKGIDMTAAVKELGRITGVYAIFLLGYIYSKTIQDIRKFQLALFTSLVVPIGVSLYQLVFGTQYIQIENYNRIYGTFGIPNMWAMYLTLPIIIVLILFLRRGIDEKKIFLGGLLGIFGILLFFTYTRASWLAFLVACTFISLEKYRRLLPYLIIGIIVLLSFTSSESLRLGMTGSSGRTALWTTLFPAGFSSPIMGQGITSMSDISKTLLGSTNQGQNQFLLYWIEGGFVGFALFSLLLFTVSKKLKECYRNLKDNYLKDLILGQIAFFGGVITIAILESNAVFQIWVWLSSGIILGVSTTIVKAPKTTISHLNDAFRQI